LIHSGARRPAFFRSNSFKIHRRRRGWPPAERRFKGGQA